MAFAVANTNTRGTQFTGTTGGSLAFTNNVTAGNALFAGSSSWSQAAAVHTVTGGGTWTRDETHNSTNVRIAGHSCASATGGATTVTLAIVTTQDCTLSICEMSHTASTTVSVDKSTHNNGTGTGESTGTTAATTNTDAVAVAHYTNEGNSSATTASAFGTYTSIYNIGDNGKMPLFSDYLVLSATGTQANACTWVNQPWAACIVVYQATAAGGGATGPPVGSLALLGVGT